MRFHHGTGDGEAKTGAARFTVRHERFEKSGQYLRWNANAGIGNAKHDLILNEVGGDGENSAANHGFAGVLNQAREHADETGAIDLEVPVVTDVFDEVNVFAWKQTQ